MNLKHSPIEFCSFCGHWINESAEKCNNCGEFVNIKTKRLWFNIAPSWLSAIAALIAAGIAIYGIYVVKDYLTKARADAIKNHKTWIEVKPLEFFTKGEYDSKDPNSTFWYILIQVGNLGSESGYVKIKDWSFESKYRGKITKEGDYRPGDREFVLKPGEIDKYQVSFVMNSTSEVEPIFSGEDALIIEFKFYSKNMNNLEECHYNATWKYTVGQFFLMTDQRNYNNNLDLSICKNEVIFDQPRKTYVPTSLK